MSLTYCSIYFYSSVQETRFPEHESIGNDHLKVENNNKVWVHSVVFVHPNYFIILYSEGFHKKLPRQYLQKLIDLAEKASSHLRSKLSDGAVIVGIHPILRI